YIVYYEIDRTLLNYHHELWHGPVAAEMIRDKFQITNPYIYRAIYYHTTDRAEMSMLEYIVFVADFNEAERNISGIDKIRRFSYQNIKMAARKALQSTIIHLMNQDAIVHPDTFDAYNGITHMIEERSSIERN